MIYRNSASYQNCIKESSRDIYWHFLVAIFLFALNATDGNAITLNPKSTAWIRLDSSISQLKLAPKGKFVAFVSNERKGLRIVDLKTRKISDISHEQVGPSFFWTPDGTRIIYREIGKSPSTKIGSIVKIYDTKLKKSVITDHYPHRTGFLTFDPKDLRFSLMHENGIHSKRISFPNSRLARWQLAQRKNTGRWVATQNGILWVSEGGLAMRKVQDDGSPVESFDISPDGQSIAWATKKGIVYTSTAGSSPSVAGFGRDPDWHPKKHILVFAGARMVGNKAIGYDIKVIDQSGRSRWVTQTQHSLERWPQWEVDREGIIFTKDKTTDLYTLDFHP